MSRRIILLFSVLIGAQSNPVPELTPCKKDDFVCQTKNSNTLLAISVAGNPERNLESLDPLYQDKIVGDLGVLQYELRNTTTEGFKDCVVASSKVQFEQSKIDVTLHCPYFNIKGQYHVSGQLLTKPIEGDGDYSFKSKDYEINISIDEKVTQGKDGQKYLSVKSFTATGDLKGGATFDATNLFNGQKELADNLLKFVNENPKPVAKVIQDPVVKANVKSIMKNLNTNLKYIPITQLFQE